MFTTIKNAHPSLVAGLCLSHIKDKHKMLCSKVTQHQIHLVFFIFQCARVHFTRYRHPKLTDTDWMKEKVQAIRCTMSQCRSVVVVVLLYKSKCHKCNAMHCVAHYYVCGCCGGVDLLRRMLFTMLFKFIIFELLISICYLCRRLSLACLPHSLYCLYKSSLYQSMLSIFTIFILFAVVHLMTFNCSFFVLSSLFINW